MNRCEARNDQGKRCRCNAVEARRVQYSDGLREFAVCLHHSQSRALTIRPAVNKSPLALQEAS